METQTNDSALTKCETTLAPVTTQRAIILREALKEDAEQRALLTKYIQQHMVKDTDYGVIPGTKKPTLLKPGAEKLVDLFRCTPKFSLLTREETFDSNFFNYMFRVRLVSRDSGAVLAEGFGSANSREGRYRWREAQRKCPKCAKATIIKGKAEYGGGWLCFAKKGGCGAKFADGAAEVEKQEIGKIENDDVATLANTILKMAKKRALVDGAIALARCSDMFTQDVEDLADPSHADDAPPPSCEPAPEPTKETKGRKSAPSSASAREAQPEPAKATAEQLKTRVRRLWEAAQRADFTADGFRLWAKNIVHTDKPSNQWTELEVVLLEEAIKTLAAEPKS